MSSLMFTSQTLFKPESLGDKSESLGDKIKKQRKANEDLKAKIAIRDKQIAQNKQKIESLEKEKKDKQNAAPLPRRAAPSQSFTMLLNQIKRNK